MVVVSRSKGEGYRAFLKSRQARVQSYLSKFMLLRQLTDSFDSLREIRQIRNALYNLCLNRSSRVKEVEDFLEGFKVPGWKSGRLSDFRGRLVQNNWEQSTSAWMEAEVTMHYSSRLDRSKVDPSPELESGNRCDIKVRPYDRSVFFELTSLGTRQFDEKLETVFGQVADHLLPRVKDGRVVYLQVNSARLPLDNEHHLDVSSSIDSLNECLDRLRLEDLFNSTISPLTVNFEDVARLPSEDKTIAQLNDERAVGGMSVLELCDYRIAQLMANESFAEWSRRIYPRIALGCPFVLMISGDGEWPLVELSSQLSYPSEAAKYEASAFLAQLKRAVSQKLTSGQMEPGAPPTSSL